jgi:hypothetical protein
MRSRSRNDVLGIWRLTSEFELLRVSRCRFDGRLALRFANRSIADRELSVTMIRPVASMPRIEAPGVTNSHRIGFIRVSSGSLRLSKSEAFPD